MFDRRFDQVLNLGQQERLGSFFSSDPVVNIDMSNPKLPVRAVKGKQPILEYFDSVRNMAAGALRPCLVFSPLDDDCCWPGASQCGL
jgi:hypothetical protein